MCPSVLMKDMLLPLSLPIATLSTCHGTHLTQHHPHIMKYILQDSSTSSLMNCKPDLSAVLFHGKYSPHHALPTVDGTLRKGLTTTLPDSVASYPVTWRIASGRSLLT